MNMIVAAIALLAVASQGFLAVQGGPIGGAGADTNAICEDQPFDEALTMEQVSSWAATLKQNPYVGCPEHIRDAIKDLGMIITQTSSNVCTEFAANAIKSFYAAYMEDGDDKQRIPKALEEFAITYAMRMSQKCKLNMAQFLAGEASELLTPEDFESVARHTLPGSDIDMLVKSIAEPGEVLLPSDLAAILPNKNEMAQKFGFKADADSDMMQLKMVCDKRFKPVYSAVVEPVAKLSRAGFDYSDKAIGNELSLNEEQTKKLDQWVRIVFICDVMDLVDGFQRTKDDQQEGSVVFMADKEAIEFAGASSGDHLEQLYFQPKNKVSMDNVEPLPEEELDQLVDDLQSRRTSAEKLKERLRSKAASLTALYMKNKALRAWKGCWWPKEGVADSEVGTSAVGRDRQMCARPSSFSSMVFQIFIAGLMALCMMMFSMM